MAKFITRSFLLAALAALLSTWVVAQTKPLELNPDAPGKYTVVPGDTLWSISGKFLQDPWRWPEIWRLNNEQLRNPHWIYPGDTIYLEFGTGGEPMLRLTRGVGEVVKLSPKVRSALTAEGGIPSIPASVIEPFLSQPLVIPPNALDGAPQIVATEESRVLVGAGDKAYVSSIPVANKQTNWHVYRPGAPLVDPENKETLGIEAFYLGTARVSKRGQPATIDIVRSAQEIRVGDRLVAVTRPPLLNYAPHAPETFVRARVISAYGGVEETGRNSIIALSRGSRDGVEVGHVMALYRHGGTVESDKKKIKLPDERYGLAFVFRVFDRVAYALVLDVKRPVQMNDVAQTP
jgi:hypothetical protein